MPFTAECQYCKTSFRVPDQAVGLSAECPACHNFFTVAPLPGEPKSLPWLTTKGSRKKEAPRTASPSVALPPTEARPNHPTPLPPHVLPGGTPGKGPQLILHGLPET